MRRRSLSTQFGRAARVFREALYPASCMMCGRFFEAASHGGVLEASLADGSWQTRDAATLFRSLMATDLCPACAATFVPVTSPLCRKCGMMFPSREGEDHLCEACLRSRHLFGIARACGVYDQALLAVIHRFKYGERVRLARALSLCLLAVFHHHWQERSIDLVIPVPLHAGRLRRRGFNQSRLIVGYWPSFMATGVGISQKIALGFHVLERIRPTPPQTGLGRRERLSNLRKAFVLRSPDRIRDRRILIVDDVFTTGATADECVRVLLQGGAQEVDVLTLARAM